MRVEVNGKAIPTRFQKIEGWGNDARWGERPEREGQLEELVGDQNPSPKASPRSKIERERREQRRCQRRSDEEE